MKWLLADPRVDPSYGQNIALRLSANNGHLEIVKLLLVDPRVDPGAENNEPIRNSAFNGHTDIVKLLLANPRVDLCTKTIQLLVTITACFNQVRVVKLLLEDSRIKPSAEWKSGIFKVLDPFRPGISHDPNGLYIELKWELSTG